VGGSLTRPPLQSICCNRRLWRSYVPGCSDEPPNTALQTDERRATVSVGCNVAPARAAVVRIRNSPLARLAAEIWPVGPLPMLCQTDTTKIGFGSAER
jgi:hypothetical protein